MKKEILNNLLVLMTSEDLAERIGASVALELSKVKKAYGRITGHAMDALDYFLDHMEEPKGNREFFDRISGVLEFAGEDPASFERVLRRQATLDGFKVVKRKGILKLEKLPIPDKTAKTEANETNESETSVSVSTEKTGIEPEKQKHGLDQAMERIKAIMAECQVTPDQVIKELIAPMSVQHAESILNALGFVRDVKTAA
jgi:hypothetical protein